jgi:DNA mismatch repair protein MutL
LPLENEEPAPRPLPENRVAAGRNHFAEPAREPEAPRFSSGGAPRPTGANYPNAQPGYQKQQGALYRKLLETPAVERKEHIPAPQPSLDGHSQSFGRVLTIIAPDMALLERDGKLMLLALPVAERWLKQVQLTPGENAACAQPLLIPVRLKISPDETRVLQRARAAGANGY